jgi:hypothetical protein
LAALQPAQQRSKAVAVATLTDLPEDLQARILQHAEPDLLCRRANSVPA